MSAVYDAWTDRVRPEKALARDIIFDEVGQCRSALFMPAASCLCIRRALHYRVINRRSHLVAVECDHAIARRMRRTLRKLNLTAAVHESMLHSVMLTEPLDFAFIDLNGALDRRTAVWINRHLSVHLAPDAVVAVTLAHAWRNNQFLPLCYDYLMTQQRPLLMAIADELPCSDYDIVTTVALFRALFHDWSFHVDFRLKYRDHGSVPMTAYRFYDFRRQPTVPHLEEIATTLLASPGNVTGGAMPVSRAPPAPARVKMEKPMTGSTAAAHKAWETRRKNAGATNVEAPKPVRKPNGLTAGQKAAATRKANAKTRTVKRRTAIKKTRANG